MRAKVAALRGQQARSAVAGVTGAATLAHQYLDWAVSQTGRPRPRLVVMAGLSGSGKTWLARRIAARCDALIVRSDVERKRLAGLQPLDTSASAPDAGIYSREFNARTYKRMRNCVAMCLRGRESVVVDAANLRRDERERFVAAGREHAAEVAIVHCAAPLEVLKRRVAGRAATGADASEATVALLDRQPSYWEPFSGDELRHVVTVDTTRPDSIERALRASAAAGKAGGPVD
ncbi:MAG: ATP-binding protein [Proteobacteria bacterium]|nr:ATP-binding protein [Pseudomonadota bacterium]